MSQELKLTGTHLDASAGSYVAWMVKHYNVLIALMGYLAAFKTGTWGERKDAIKAAVALVLDSLDDFPTNVVAPTPEDLQAYCSHPVVEGHYGAIGDGKILAWIVANGPAIWAFVQMIIGLIKTGA